MVRAQILGRSASALKRRPSGEALKESDGRHQTDQEYNLVSNGRAARADLGSLGNVCSAVRDKFDHHNPGKARTRTYTGGDFAGMWAGTATAPAWLPWATLPG